MKQVKRFIPVLLLCFLLAGCGEKTVQKEIFAMDTVMTFTAYGKNAEQGLNDAISEINRAEQELDPEAEGSTVWQLNHANGTPIKISQFIYDMFTSASGVYQRANGALDLTIYPAVKSWGFLDGQYAVPSQSILESLSKQVDFSSVTFWEESGKYYAQLPAGTEISFGAVAKGAMAQEVIDTLKDAGVESAIISLGGNVQTLGVKPGAEGWNIAVQDPNDPAGSLGVLFVGETALVTSGSYQRYFEQDGKIYHHILNPETLSPADSGLLSVTVVCRDGTMADCLSTALFVLGEEGALDYWRTYGGLELTQDKANGQPTLAGGFEMILVTNDGRVLLTDGLEGYFTPGETDYTYQYTG